MISEYLELFRKKTPGLIIVKVFDLGENILIKAVEDVKEKSFDPFYFVNKTTKSIRNMSKKDLPTIEQAFTSGKELNIQNEE